MFWDWKITSVIKDYPAYPCLSIAIEQTLLPLFDININPLMPRSSLICEN